MLNTYILHMVLARISTGTRTTSLTNVESSARYAPSRPFSCPRTLASEKHPGFLVEKRLTKVPMMPDYWPVEMLELIAITHRCFSKPNRGPSGHLLEPSVVGVALRRAFVRGYSTLFSCEAGQLVAISLSRLGCASHSTFEWHSLYCRIVLKLPP